MALLVPQKVYTDGALNRVAVYRVFGVTTGDTIQLSGDFQNITDARFIPATGVQPPAAAGISANTLITISAASIAKDDGWLVVYGSSIQQ